MAFGCKAHRPWGMPTASLTLIVSDSVLLEVAALQRWVRLKVEGEGVGGK